MLKFKNIRSIWLILSLPFLILSGCSTKPKVTFEQMAKWQEGVFISEIFGLAVNPLSGWTRQNEYRIRSHIGEVEDAIYGIPDVSDEKFQKSDNFFPLLTAKLSPSGESKEAIANFRIFIGRTERLYEISNEDSDELLQMIEYEYSNQDLEPDITFGDIHSCTIGEQQYRCLSIIFNKAGMHQLIAIRLIDGFAISLLFVANSSHPELIDEAIGAFSLYP